MTPGRCQADEDQTRFWAEDITVHEWAHAISNLGFDDATRREWLELFSRAREAGVWPDAFAMKVDSGREFFAELSQSYLGVNNEIGGPEDLYSEGTDGILARDICRPGGYLRAGGHPSASCPALRSYLKL